MFAVHSLSGLSLRAPLEQLSRISEARALRRNDTDYEPAFVAKDEAPSRYQTAAQAYRSMLPKSLDRGPVKHAWQIMSRRLIKVRHDDSIEAAWRVLVKGRVRQAMVVNGEGVIVGLVSERDILKCINIEAGQVRDVRAGQVGEVMTTPVVSADPVTDIRRIAQAFLDYHLPGMPIVEENGLAVGFISRGDILRSVVTDPPLSLWS